MNFIFSKAKQLLLSLKHQEVETTSESILVNPSLQQQTETKYAKIVELRKKNVWSGKECALLIVALEDIYFGKKEKSTVITELSSKLRAMGRDNGANVNDLYRNKSGIALQMLKMEFLLTNGKKGLSGASKEFKRVYDSYKSDINIFNKEFGVQSEGLFRPQKSMKSIDCFFSQPLIARKKEYEYSAKLADILSSIGEELDTFYKKFYFGGRKQHIIAKRMMAEQPESLTSIAQRFNALESEILDIEKSLYNRIKKILVAYKGDIKKLFNQYKQSLEFSNVADLSWKKYYVLLNKISSFTEFFIDIDSNKLVEVHKLDSIKTISETMNIEISQSGKQEELNKSQFFTQSSDIVEEKTAQRTYSEYLTIENLFIKGLISVRIRNALTNVGYEHLEDLYEFSFEDLKKIPNMGKKSARDLLEIIFIESTKEFSKKILKENGKDVDENDETISEKAKSISINRLNLSSRSSKALEKYGIYNLKQLLDLSTIEIQKIPCVGRLSWLEIIRKREEGKQKIKEGSLVSTRDKLQKISSYLLDKNILSCRFSYRLEHILVLNGISTIRDVLRYSPDNLLKIKNFGKKSFAELECFLKEQGIVLGENYEEDQSRFLENSVTFKELISEIQREVNTYIGTEYLIYEKRIKTVTPVPFRELANELNLSTERVRQIEKKIKKKLLKIISEYKSVFDKIFKKYGMMIAYNLIPEWREFIIYTPILKSLCYKNSSFPYIVNTEESLISETLFFEKLQWNSFVDGENKNLSFELQKDILIKNLMNLVGTDSYCIENYTRISAFLENELHALWNKKYLYLENRRIPATKVAILDLFLQKYCENTISLEDFVREFNIWLEKNNINDIKYSDGMAAIRNTIAQKDNVLWTTGFRFRYYPMEHLNVKRFINILDLNRYNNSDFSSRKIYLDYPELMKEYDIRDEYELHNFLRKQVALFPDDLKVEFARMPTLRFGLHNKKQQALEIIHAQAPISVKDFIRIYSDKYGLAKSTIVANIVPLVSNYLTSGIFTDVIEEFPQKLFDFLSRSLTEDFYLIEEIKQLIKNNFSCDISKYITTYNFKKLHFAYNTEYIYSEKYSSANDYFHEYLSKISILDLNEMKTLRYLRAFLATLNTEVNCLNYIEFSRNKYISITKLEQLNITKTDIQTYIKMVSEFVDDDFFTIKYLRNKGFNFSKLEDLGFDDFFLSSILKTSNCFNVKSVNGTYIFIKKNIPLKVEAFLEKIVGSYRKIDIYDLGYLLKEKYDIDFQKHELISFAKNSDLYYNPIMEKFYVNYDEFFETV